MKILISTGIYPPKIGGPAQYSKNLKDSLSKMGHIVKVKTFTIEEKIPSGLRHLFFLIKIIPSVFNSEVIFVLDTFSVALPTIFLAKILNKKTIIRTGGDFLWEQYVERTGKKVLLGHFYRDENINFSFKEKFIFRITKWILNNTSHIIFSTIWQRDIFLDAYNVNNKKVSIVENYYGEKECDLEYVSKEFIASTRKLKWKNLDILESVFGEISKSRSDVTLFSDTLPFKDLMDRMKSSYCTVLVSIGDISPNMILDSIRYNRPFICTKEVGIYDRIKDAGIFVDPLDSKAIKEAVLYVLSEEGYVKAKDMVRNFNFVHTWDQIALEFMQIVNKI